MVSLGREGYREHAREIFETAAAMMDVVRSHPELRIMGDGTSGAPTFCFSFTSDDFEIYHLVDFLGPKGWRFNGQQYPNAIHMAVTRPQTRAGVVEPFDGRPGRRGRVREGEARGRRGGLRRRDLRRGGRRARPGDLGLHRRRHGRHARQAASPATRMSDTAGDLVLAVDLGTGGPKVGLVTVRGEIVWWEHTPVPTHAGPGGEQTQDAEQWWQVVARVRTPRRGGPPTSSRVVAVSVTGQWASHGPGGRGTVVPVGPCVLWSDTRGAPYSRAAVGGPVSGLRAEAAGHVAASQRWDPDGRRATTRSATSCFLQHEQPDVVARARWLLEPVDYLTMRFTGVPAASHASMTGAWLTDNRSLATLAYDDVLVRATGVDASRLPPLVATGSVVGTLSPSVAADLGLPPTAVAVTGLPDLHSAAVGAGAIGLGEPHASIGTTAWISAPVPRKKSDLLRMQASVPGLDNASYLLANNQESAGRNLQWWRDAVAPELGYDDLLAEAAATPPGAGGVLFTPWLTGERSPVDDRNARAGFHGIGGGTTRGHLTRAVLEGVALNATLAARGGREVRRVPARRHPARRRGSAVGPLVPGPGRHQRPVDRPGHRPLVGRPPRSVPVRGADAGRRRPRLRCAGWCPPTSRSGPTRARRATYDALVRELPKLYAAQKGFFRRRSART